MSGKDSNGPGGGPQSEETVFVVDDDPDVRDSLASLLTATNFRVETFESARTFLSGGVLGTAALTRRTSSGFVSAPVAVPLTISASANPRSTASFAESSSLVKIRFASHPAKTSSGRQPGRLSVVPESA